MREQKYWAQKIEFEKLAERLFPFGTSLEKTVCTQCKKPVNEAKIAYMGFDVTTIMIALGEYGAEEDRDYLAKLQEHPCWAVAADEIIARYK